MARPREFDEEAVLDAAVRCFWSRGFEATSVRDLIETTGLTGASLYNAFGDKRALYRRALGHYVEASIAGRIQRCEALSPRAAIGAFFAEIIARSLGDGERKGCMLVNAALELAPHDAEMEQEVAQVLGQLEAFFLRHVAAGQADGSISTRLPAPVLASHLLCVLLGVRVLARARPEPAVIEGAISGALALLDGGAAPPG